jgi:hypothetical protein
MTNTNANRDILNPVFHPAAHYASPEDVLNDNDLSTPEKRIILSSWASDMFAVESCPALREIPGMGHTITLADILAALRELDGDEEPAPRGGRRMLRGRAGLPRGGARGEQSGLEPRFSAWCGAVTGAVASRRIWL